MINIAVIGKNDQLANLLLKRFESAAALFGQDLKVFVTRSISNYLDSHLSACEMVILIYNEDSNEILEGLNQIREADPFFPLVFVIDGPKELAYSAAEYRPFAITTVKDLDKLFIKEKFMSLCDLAIKESAKAIGLKTRSSIIKVRLNDIAYIEVFGHNLSIKLMNKKIITITGKMKRAEELLTPLGFFRCHECYLVNLKNVQSLTATCITVADEMIPFSKRRKAAMKALVKKYFDGTSIYVYKGVN